MYDGNVTELVDQELLQLIRNLDEYGSSAQREEFLPVLWSRVLERPDGYTLLYDGQFNDQEEPFPGATGRAATRLLRVVVERCTTVEAAREHIYVLGHCALSPDRRPAAYAANGALHIWKSNVNWKLRGREFLVPLLCGLRYGTLPDRVREEYESLLPDGVDARRDFGRLSYWLLYDEDDQLQLLREHENSIRTESRISLASRFVIGDLGPVSTT